jgi:hypothetical protein
MKSFRLSVARIKDFVDRDKEHKDVVWKEDREEKEESDKEDFKVEVLTMECMSIRQALLFYNRWQAQ